ncbi:Phosphoglycerate kinase [Caldivirga maquilingensis IC-167]|uniref:Phosphoglycerate kinase n=1 Tax=Caldivirga maquilingensis (strain ATCC 700844 / DSM 13496 / JCM 10307 / IC-167) TaxID=397948 RepID=A8MAY3_CALMQ|nr:Phosphoglycerate kinase [Caldivirga maquilingensis IC-167]
MGGLTIPTMDDIDIRSKKVLLRIDINSPVDENGKIIDDSRIKAHVETIKELIDKDNSVVLMSHQGRPGDKDFISLEEHSKLISKHLNREVIFVDDVIGPYAREIIKNLKNGEILLLDNVRLISEELIEAPPQQHVKTFLVRKLTPFFNIYINDAFATAHRSQPSIVGFPLVLPSAAGRVMEREVSALARIFNAEDTPKIFVLGGGKVHDTIRIIENLMRTRIADRILTGGLVAELFSVAKGMNLNTKNMEILERMGILSLVPRARKLLLSGAPIEIPVDYKVEINGNVIEEPASKITGVIKDIGPATVEIYSSLIKDAKVVVLRGPMGVIEDERFRDGSKSVLKASLEGWGYVIIGGGHMISALDKDMKIDNNKVHISTGGGALLLFLSGERLPALEALSMSMTNRVMNNAS